MTQDRSALLDMLAFGVDTALACFDVDREALGRSYAPGKWTARQILLHTCDAETVFFDRLRRLAADERPLLWAYDENRWSAALAYERRSVPVAKDLFASTRRSVIDLVASLPAEALERTGVHSEAGVKSFAQVVDSAAAHAAHHLDQVRAIAERRPWPAAARA